MAATTIPVRWSPDTVKLLRYMENAFQRMRDRTDDARIRGLMAEITESAHAGKMFCDSDFEAGSVIVTPGDELMRLVAKTRAVERAVFG